MRALLIVAGLALLLAHSDASSASEPEGPRFTVIVHADNDSARDNPRFLANAFLKKVTRWPNGELIRPVDLAADVATRRAFSQQILNRSVPSVKSYWQQFIFTGRGVPPPELAGDDEVLDYVRTHLGAVGYVSASVRLSGVRALVTR